MQLSVGDLVEGKVTGITNFGVFVDLPEGKTGMVHISEVARTYVNDINEHVKQGDTVFCADMTFGATVNPVIYEKAKPVCTKRREKYAGTAADDPVCTADCPGERNGGGILAGRCGACRMGANMGIACGPACEADAGRNGADNGTG